MAKSREEYVDTEYEAPHPGLEMRAAEIIAEVLDVDRVGRTDSFHDLGGTSLQAIRILARIENVLGIKMPPLSLYTNDLLADFVADMGNPTEGTDV